LSPGATGAKARDWRDSILSGGKEQEQRGALGRRRPTSASQLRTPTPLLRTPFGNVAVKMGGVGGGSGGLGGGATRGKTTARIYLCYVNTY